MSIARVVSIAIAGIQLFMGFYLIRYGVLAGLVERSIRTTKYSQEKVTGLTAVGWGLFYLAVGMVFLFVATFLLVAAFGA